MFKKIAVGFIILAVIFISISSVSANGLNDTNVSDFDDLTNQINQTSEGQTLSLDKDYHNNNSSQNQIVIDKSMTIDGNNHSIKADDVSRVFWVKADNVCIKNINFISAKSTSLAGGVISWWGNNGTLENCNFINNSAISAGGAVLWKGNLGNIINCNFTGNNVKYGAAVSLTDGGGYDPSKPHIMSVNCDGGALYLSGNDIIVDYCNFYNNIALLNGGAISINFGNNVKISNSRFKNNSAEYNGGAIDWNGQNAMLANSTFENNAPKSLFLNTNAVIANSTFDLKSSIESWYSVEYINVTFNDIGSFEDLSLLVNSTPHGGILVLDKDYEYINGSNKGVLISKSITIDGAGHTLNGNKLSRMFNITADNVFIRNVNFKNGNAFGRYGGIAGGGAIYWSGDNGFLENCNFTDNAGSGIEDDPYDKEETIINDDGTIVHIIRFRPMGAKINEGGAIVWSGKNGTVSKSIFINNNVGYPNSGGAICWRGDNGKIIDSQFYKNDAWCGSAVCWVGDNGLISTSIIANSTFFDGGIYWFGKNGTVTNSILLNSAYRSSLTGPSDLNANYNFWGDTLENPNSVSKTEGASNWLVMKFSHNGEFVEKGDKLVIKCDITTLVDKNGKMSYYDKLIDYSSQFTFTANKDGFLKIYLVNGEIKVDIDSRNCIISKNLTKYYTKKKTSFSVKVYDFSGKVVGKTVKFRINKKNYYANTNKKGVATIKIKLKPGRYKIYTYYDDVKVKNTIIVKKTLITKNINKKVNREAKFKVKVLNSKGKAYSKQTVKIKFKSNTYKIKTNKKGIATFNIPDNLKVGKYKIKTIYNGLTNTNKIIVKK